MSSVLFSGVPIAVVVEVYNYSQLGTLEMSIRMADCTCAHCRCFPMLMNSAPVPRCFEWNRTERSWKKSLASFLRQILHRGSERDDVLAGFIS
jgi:hypothetical protein